MYTIIDYLNYYKDLTLEEATFNKIDILLFSILVYLPGESFNKEISLPEFYDYTYKYHQKDLLLKAFLSSAQKLL